MDAFQADVACIALGVAFDHGFALAGGNALVAHGLVDRPTQDVNLFTPEAGGPATVLDAVCTALREHGYAVQVLRHPQDHNGEFGELAVTGVGPVGFGAGRGLPRDYIDIAAAAASRCGVRASTARDRRAPFDHNADHNRRQYWASTTKSRCGTAPGPRSAAGA